MVEQKLYRPNAGTAIFNQKGEVLICRLDTSRWRSSYKEYCWQMPQGGIESGETLIEAAYRETKEETNINQSSLKFLKQACRSHYYDFPEPKEQYVGQEQTWLAFEFLGDDHEIDVINCPDSCFIEWRWEKLEKTPSLIVPFKKETYQFMVSEFQDLY